MTSGSRAEGRPAHEQSILKIRRELRALGCGQLVQGAHELLRARRPEAACAGLEIQENFANLTNAPRGLHQASPLHRRVHQAHVIERRATAAQSGPTP